MKSHLQKGEIGTIIAISALVIIGVSSFVSSVFLSQRQTTSTRASSNNLSKEQCLVSNVDKSLPGCYVDSSQKCKYAFNGSNAQDSYDASGYCCFRAGEGAKKTNYPHFEEASSNCQPKALIPTATPTPFQPACDGKDTGYGKNWCNECSQGVRYGQCAGSGSNLYRCVGGSWCGSFNCYKKVTAAECAGGVTISPNPTSTNTPAPVATNTPTPTTLPPPGQPTNTPVPTTTNIPIPTRTPTPTATPTRTIVPSNTPTPTVRPFSQSIPQRSTSCQADGLGLYLYQPNFLNNELCDNGRLSYSYSSSFVPDQLINVFDAIGQLFWVRTKDLLAKSTTINKLKVFLGFMIEKGCVPMVAYGYRSYDVQKQLYESEGCQPGQSCVAAPPGWSSHQSGIAFDIFCIERDTNNEIIIKAVTKEIIDSAPSYGFIHPIHWDTPHFFTL